jgi:hypothetical protein
MAHRKRKLISRLVTNKSPPYYGYERAVDPENPGTGPGSTYGWEDCDPAEGQEVDVSSYDPNYYQPEQPGGETDGGVGLTTAEEIQETIPGARIEARNQGAQLLFGTYASEADSWNVRATPTLRESVDNILRAHSEFPETWVVEVVGQEIIERVAGPSTATAKVLGQVNAQGDHYSRLKARIRYGTAENMYVDIDIGNGTRMVVEGSMVQVSILTPDTNYRVSAPDSTIDVPAAETAVLTDSYITAAAYITETLKESWATYTEVLTVEAGGNLPLTRIDIPPRAYSLSLYSNVALPAPVGFDDSNAFGSAQPAYNIVQDATTLRAEDIVIPQNCAQLRVPAIVGAAADTQITIVYTIR